MNKVMERFKEFFESYEVANLLMDINNVKVHIFEAKSKALISVRLVEVQRQYIRGKKLEKNTFADLKIENNQIKMVFKVVKVTNDFKSETKKVIKNNYVVKYIGSNLNITISNPSIEEIIRVFTVIEPYCKKYKE